MQNVETSQPADEMDYAEHANTYKLFLSGAKYGTVIIGALLVAMAAGLVGPFGFISSLIIFILISAIGLYILR
ncbi:aa3-type cytochrome c oxidase subunit IV [Martelella lutilitoris]|uniref:Aa3-type cytochrome c oxidase subunit IV n=1 Tax=Martelella lutilitoris TaxID=2583532 RepID=A0A5C4JPT0_9HYPH|nr:aa3-type cytochrome c oxidase subunit IV [Martelella lutilitoris]TNB47495.1 aa3-type cytochrome c oxidase subunit IV [Martelella lutilitoris]